MTKDEYIETILYKSDIFLWQCIITKRCIKSYFVVCSNRDIIFLRTLFLKGIEINKVKRLEITYEIILNSVNDVYLLKDITESVYKKDMILLLQDEEIKKVFE